MALLGTALAPVRPTLSSWANSNGIIGAWSD